MQINAQKKLITIAVVIVILSFYLLAAIPFHWFPFQKTEIPCPPKDTSLDYSFIRNMTENLSYIIFNAYNVTTGEIAKGRGFGTKGEWRAADLIEENFTKFGFYSTREQIENIDYPFRVLDLNLNLTTKLEVLEQKITVTNTSSGNETPIVDCHISPRWNHSLFNPFYDRSQLNHTFIENNLTVLHAPPNDSYFGPGNTSWFDDFILNTTIKDLMLDNNDTIYDLASLFDFLLPLFEEYYNFSFENLDPENESTFPTGLVPFNETANGYVLIEEDRAFNPEPEPPAWEPDYFIPENGQIVKWIHLFRDLVEMKIWYRLNPQCKGILRYDFNDDTYDMNLNRFLALPILYINGTIGKEINESVENFTINYTLGQQYNESVISYNVIGQINGTDSSKTVIVSSLYDSWWCQGTADSAIGMSIVLAIAKYFKDYNITPSCTLKFIAFAGEEYGRVGARYYEAKHSDEKIIAVIDVNQVGFDNPDPQNNPELKFEIWTNQPHRLLLKNLVSEIVDRTNYSDRTGINYTINSGTRGGYIGNKDPFAINRLLENIKTVYFVKDFGWIYHHRDGLNHTQGDVMNYYNETDVKVTGEMILNVTYAFVIKPPFGVAVLIPFFITIAIIVVAVILIWKKEYLLNSLIKRFEN